MKAAFLTGFLIMTLMFSSFSHAGKDPVAWSLFPSSGFPASTTVGSSYAVSYTLTNNLPFAVLMSVTGSYVGGSFGLSNNCNTTLAPAGSSGSSCIFHLHFQPTTTGTHTAQMTIGYHKNKVALPILTSNTASAETVDHINGVVTTSLPAVTYVGTSYPIVFTFINDGPTAVTATAVNVTGFTASTNTCTAQLGEDSTCTVSGNFTPTSAIQYTLTATYVYTSSGTSVSVPLSSQTNAQNGSGGCHNVKGKTVLPLPTQTLIYGDHMVRFDFVNECTSTTETLGQVSFSSDASGTAPTITTSSSLDTCSNQTLAASGSCSVYASVIPNAIAADLHITATVPYNNATLYADRTTHSPVNALTNQSTEHTIMFVNQCPNHVWYGFQNGNGSGSGITYKSPDPTPAAYNTWQGHQLNIQADEKAPVPVIFQFPEYANGAIAGRTHCETDPTQGKYGTCLTANCTSLTYNGVSNTTGTCNQSTGFLPPTTLFEENLFSTPATDGSYDISLINGFNIPGEFRSLAPFNPYTPGSSHFDQFSNGCGQSAGGVIQPSSSTLVGCPWTFTLTSGTTCSGTDVTGNFYNVTPDSTDACASACTGSNVCGMNYTTQPASNPVYLGTQINRGCGQFLGYWTINDWIGYSNGAAQWSSCNLYDQYALATTLDSIKTAQQPSFGTLNSAAVNLANLFGCTAITSNGSLESGYQQAGVLQPLNVCGCEDWQVTINGTTYTVPSEIPCQNKDVTWHDHVLSHISWLKNACSTVYVFPYDDKSTSFSCNVSGQRTSYQVTFCPGAKTGVPS